MSQDPPYKKAYNSIFKMYSSRSNVPKKLPPVQGDDATLPLIDLSRLFSGEIEHERCVEEMVEAASEWGFFQVVNHGVPQEVLDMVYHEGRKVFDQPCSEKTRENFLNLSKNSYRRGNPNATSPSQFFWSEALQIDLTEIPNLPEDNKNLRTALEACVQEMTRLAQMMCELLGKRVKVKPNYFEENCIPANSNIRINKYPPCLSDSEIVGLIPHTDTDFITVLSQDTVGGLELKNDGRWLAVKPRPDALIVNIGDLFQNRC
ncbi:PREDICTED: gibberellin 2-beta-dioxygenase 7 isoform X2 [Tarenaya hassleriana]|uniref:gibberellin 2-beta-dioxygenase 7 isoform X2 n=1 Tax=Tarenaya hassleriana TaxID=28532 RepID=UPI00053C5BF4|nr:PREDICTED: gibberellin 2-beta-dioxygenase 7 isoform X2 [Tarenaya hassleriana]